MEREPSREMDPRLLLPRALLDVHRQAALATLNELGIEINTWDAQIVRQLEDDIDLGQKLDEHELAISMINFEGYGSGLWRDSFGKLPVHTANILNYPYFSLDYSGNCYPTLILPLPKSPAGRPTKEYEADAIEHPAKYIEVILYKTTEPGKAGDSARIYIGSDAPPIAIHNDDLTYVERQTELEAGDLRIIGKTAEMFGPESLDYLSEETCRVLIGALQTTPAKTAKQFHI